MSTLLELTLRGSLMLAVVTALDRMLANRVTARARRRWWLSVPLAFLVTVPLSILPAPAAASASRVSRQLLPVASLDAMVHADAAPEKWACSPLVPLVPLVAAGAAVSMLIALVRTRSALRRWGRERLSTDTALLNVLEDCKAEAGVSAPIALVVSDAVTTPVILGWLRPRILLPAALATSFSRDQLRAVLFHELAHFRAGDIPFNWLFTLVGAMHWFNPAAHLALRAWTRVCEAAADETAIACLGEPSAIAYGETLLHVLNRTSGHPAPFSALAIAESVSQLRKRLHMIKLYQHRKSHLSWLAGTIVALLALGILLRPVQAGDAPVDPKTVANGTMQTWLQEIDQNKYAQSWTDSAAGFQKAISQDNWVAALNKVRTPLGHCKERRLASASLQTDPEGAEKGDYIMAQFDTSFDGLKYAVETVSFMKAPDGSWKAIGYFIKPNV